MHFSLGKPILLMSIIAVACGIVSVTRSSPPKADLSVWTFTDQHARIFRGDRSTTQPTLVDLFRQQTGESVAVSLMSGNAINLRLNSIFDNAGQNEDMPDLVEIEIGMVGRFFRPPVNQVGFLPLNDRIAKSGLAGRILASRLAPWSKEGVIFGLPHDVHPVSICYRRDLFDEAGVDLATAKTWPAFQAKCLAFQSYWVTHGIPRRRAIEMASDNADAVIIMLQQRHLNLLDSDNTSHMTDPRVADCVSFYAHCVAGPRVIAGDASPGGNNWIRDIANGDLCSAITADWGAGYIRTSGPDLFGKMAMMPLPRFDPTDAPTASWGGTMIAIPKQARDPEKSWRLMQFLYLSPPSMTARIQVSGILPPVIDAWNDPNWHTPDPYFGGQKIGELNIELARQLPNRSVTPFTVLATQGLIAVLNHTTRAIQAGEEAGLDDRIAGWLAEADAEVQKRIAFGRFDQ